MGTVPKWLELMQMPTASGRDGIHICAQLRVDGMQLERIARWATDTMERAAKHIEALEKIITDQAAAQEGADAPEAESK